MKPKSTRPTVTRVPNLLQRASLTQFPKPFCMAGMCNKTTIVKYVQTIAHTAMLIVLMMRFDTVLF